MNILFDISHPAHFHLFKNTITQLNAESHATLITARDKDVLFALLRRDNLAFHNLAKSRQSFVGLFFELMMRNAVMYRICRSFKPDLLIGTSVNITHVGRLIGKPSIVVNEDDDAVVPAFSWLAYPLTNRIVNPSCIAFRRWKKKRVFHNSYHELAYLHPDNFTPDRSILGKYSLREKGYVLARFSALKAHHDVGARGISKEMWSKIENSMKDFQIVRSFETGSSHEIEPWDMHHVLAFAKMIISDSQTMTIEGAVLGVPAVRINTFIGKSTVIDELEKKYGLAFGFLPDKEDAALRMIQSLLSDPLTDEVWQKKRLSMLSEKEDMTAWLVSYINSYRKEI